MSFRSMSSRTFARLFLIHAVIMCCAPLATAIADQAPAEKLSGLAKNIVSTFENADAVAMTALYTRRGSNDVSLIPTKRESGPIPIRFDLLMAKGGMFRVRAVQQDRELVEIACDGRQVIEWDRRENRWTRYPAADRSEDSAVMRLWTGRAWDDSIGFPLSRFAASWVTKPCHYQWFFQRLQLANEQSTETQTVSERQCDVATAKQVNTNGVMKAEYIVRAAYEKDTHLPVLEEVSVHLRVPPLGEVTADRLEYVSMTLNPPVNPGAFTLEPPGDAEFIDPQDLRPMVPLLVGKSVADWEVKMVDGPPLRLVDPERPGPKVVVAWATWCAPCKAELALLARLRNDPDFAQVGVKAVSIDHAEGPLRAFLKQNPQPFPVGWEPDFLERLATSVVPTTLIIDQQGVVREMWSGWNDNPADVADQIDKVRAAVREATK